ncbi:MAG: Spo0E like sporulation regulatory protein [Paenibacillus sp.]|nr:Spo0E like sporulation regulatory protein [Paenibacillus sp.]
MHIHMGEHMKRERINPNCPREVEQQLRALEDAIYKKRMQLHECVETYGIADPRCLHNSIELDHLLNIFNRLQKDLY